MLPVHQSDGEGVPWHQWAGLGTAGSRSVVHSVGGGSVCVHNQENGIKNKSQGCRSQFPLELMKTQSGFAEEKEYVDMSKMRERAELLTSLAKTMKI